MKAFKNADAALRKAMMIAKATNASQTIKQDKYGWMWVVPTSSITTSDDFRMVKAQIGRVL